VVRVSFVVAHAPKRIEKYACRQCRGRCGRGYLNALAAYGIGRPENKLQDHCGGFASQEVSAYFSQREAPCPTCAKHHDAVKAAVDAEREAIIVEMRHSIENDPPSNAKTWISMFIETVAVVLRSRRTP